MTSATNAGDWAAERATTNRSTLPGRAPRSGTQRMSSMASTPGLTTTIRSRGKPSRTRLRRMTRPGFEVLETPTIATDRGSSSRASLCTGLGRRVGVGPSPSVTRTSRATSPSTVTPAGLTSHSRSSAGTRAAPSASKRSTTSTRCPSGRRGGWPRSDVVARRTAVVASSAGPIASRGVRDGETIAISHPGRRSAARASVWIPPPPTLTTTPKSSVQRRESSSSPPSAVSCSTCSTMR